MRLIACTILAAGLASGCATLSPESPSKAAIASADHWVPAVSAADGKPVKLYVREKYARAPAGKRAVILAHGSGTPGSVAFDLQVADAPTGTYSMMDYLAAQGFDVFSVDYQNYGRSDKHACGLCVTTAAAARDLDAVVDYVRRLRNVDKVDLVGWSWGTNVSGLMVAEHPQKVRRMVMYAPPLWTKARRAAPTTEFRVVTPENSRNLFEAPASDPAAVEAWTNGVARWGAQAPNGVLLDLDTRMPLLDAKRIPVPTMIVFGELDRLTPISEPNIPVFFMALPSNDKQLTLIPGAGHALVVQKPRKRLYDEVTKWLRVE